VVSTKLYPVLSFFVGVVSQVKQAEISLLIRCNFLILCWFFSFLYLHPCYPFFFQWCFGFPVHDHDIPTYNKIWSNFWSYLIKWGRWGPGCILQGPFALYHLFLKCHQSQMRQTLYRAIPGLQAAVTDLCCCDYLQNFSSLGVFLTADFSF